MAFRHLFLRNRLSALMGAAVLLFTCHPRAASTASETSPKETTWTIQTLSVQDENGKPIPYPDVVLVNPIYSAFACAQKAGDEKGIVQLSASDIHGNDLSITSGRDYDIFVRAAGMAPLVQHWKAATSTPLTVTLAPGKPVEIVLKPEKGTKLPADLLPVIVPEEFAFSALAARDSAKFQRQSRWMESLGENHYRVYLNEQTSPMLFMLNKPGAIVGFSTRLDPAELLKSKSIQIKIPAPGKLAVKIEVPEKLQTSASGKTVVVTAYAEIDMGKDADNINADMSQKEVKLTSPTAQVELADLAPGQYYVSVQEKKAEDAPVSTGTQTLAFREAKDVDITSTETATVSFTYKEFDPASIAGNLTASVSVKNLDGTPASGMRYRVTTYLPDYGEYYVITSGTLNADGKTTISGLQSRGSRLTSDEQYGRTIGRLPSLPGAVSATFTFTIPPAAGDIAPDITLIDVNTSEPVTLSSLRGKVVFLDFWATWCGPCQKPMAHNQKVLEENGKRWGDRVVIAGASIDDSQKTVIDHVKKNGWEAVRHLWCGDESFNAAPAAKYGIDSVPTAFLIDQDGKIIWRGHPSGYDLVREIDKLLEKN